MSIYKEELAKEMYAAYGNATDNKDFKGEPMPKWEELPEPQRNAWLAVANYVIFDIVL